MKLAGNECTFNNIFMHASPVNGHYLASFGKNILLYFLKGKRKRNHSEKK